MKKKILLPLMIFFILLFGIYKIVVEPVIGNQKELDIIVDVLASSNKDIDSYKKLEISNDTRSFTKEVQKYRGNDYMTVEVVNEGESVSSETICIDDKLYITSFGDYERFLEKSCYEDFNLLDINISGLIIENYEDNLISFDYYDDYTKIVFKKAAYETSDLSTLSPLLKDAQLTHYEILLNNDDSVVFNFKFKNSLDVSLFIDNSRVLKKPKLEN